MHPKYQAVGQSISVQTSSFFCCIYQIETSLCISHEMHKTRWYHENNKRATRNKRGTKIRRLPFERNSDPVSAYAIFINKIIIFYVYTMNAIDFTQTDKETIWNSLEMESNGVKFTIRFNQGIKMHYIMGWILTLFLFTRYNRLHLQINESLSKIIKNYQCYKSEKSRLIYRSIPSWVKSIWLYAKRIKKCCVCFFTLLIEGHNNLIELVFFFMVLHVSFKLNRKSSTVSWIE